MLTKTEAVVLKSMKYRDTSKVVTFYTKEYGKIKGIAKGARTAKNKYGSSLEPMTKACLVLYKKEHRDLHLISQCDAIDSFRHLSEDLDRLSMALAVLELVNQVTHDEERKPVLYNLLVEILSALDCSTKNYANYLQAFRLRLAAIYGYAPNFDQCGTCGKPIATEKDEKRFEFQIARGAIVCNRCLSRQSVQRNRTGQFFGNASLSVQGLQVFRRLFNALTSSLGNIEYDARTGNEIDTILRLYMRYHLEGLKPLKSTEMFFHN